jgi:hypothetical protein
MAELTPEQEATRTRVEGLIAVAAPFLDVLLGIGERISRIAEPTDHEYYPIRPGPEASEIRSGLEAVPAEDGEIVTGTAEEIPIDGPDARN